MKILLLQIYGRVDYKLIHIITDQVTLEAGKIGLEIRNIRQKRVGFGWENS